MIMKTSETTAGVRRDRPIFQSRTFGGVTFGADTGWFGAFRGRYFGPRPLIEDDSVRSRSSLIFNARAGYKFDNGVRLQLDVLNLFNADTNQIEQVIVVPRGWRGR